MVYPLTDDETDGITHYGVKGMKWGQRKNSTGRGEGRKPGAQRLSKDHKTAQRIKKKKLSQMSNDDLEKLNKRLQLEKKYADMNPSKIRQGKDKAQSILQTANLANMAVTVATGAAATMVVRALSANRQNAANRFSDSNGLGR